jgi:hypothetical protein
MRLIGFGIMFFVITIFLFSFASVVGGSHLSLTTFNCDLLGPAGVVDLKIVTNSLNEGYENVFYSIVLEARGTGGPYNWSVLSLPQGLSFDSMTGEIFGAPEVFGDFDIEIEVREGNSFDRKILPVKIYHTESNEGGVFVPGVFVPLSGFVESNPNSEDYAITLQVNKDILDYIDSSGSMIGVACNDGILSFNFPSYVDYINGSVVYISDKFENCTVVSSTPSRVFENDFPIVTHWRADLNWDKDHYRGGFEIGASDELPVVLGNDSSSPYFLNSEYAIFSDDPYRNPPVADYGIGVSENFAITSIDSFWAVNDSNTVLKETGYPVIHRNYPWALNSSSLSERQVNEEVPAFQVLHAHMIAVSPDKGSIATFLLPPNWTRAPLNPYPILFNTFYDLHGGSYRGHGTYYMNIAGGLQNDDKGQVMGVLWSGDHPYNPSFYDNAEILFGVASSLGGDPHKIVVTGGSRGGTLGLRLASNPSDNYTVALAVVYGVVNKIGEHVCNYSSVTYFGALGSISMTAGYKYSWKSGWKNPVSNLSLCESVLKVFINSTDQEQGDHVGLWGNESVQNLKNKGTKVILVQGTHDHFIPMNLHVKYLDKLVDAGIPLEARIYYRFGHSNMAQDRTFLLENGLTELLGNREISISEGTFHYRRESEENYQVPVLFDPVNQPIVFEAPKYVSWGQTFPFVFIGDSNTTVELSVYKINDSLWEENETVLKESQEDFFNFNFTFEDSLNPIETSEKFVVLPADGSVLSGHYLYEVFFTRQGENRTKLPEESVPYPSVPKHPVFEILEEEYDISGSSLHSLGEETRIWGMSSEMIDS